MTRSQERSSGLPLEESLREQQRRASRGDLAGLAKRFQQKLAKVNEVPWALATSVDFLYPETEGGRPSWMSRLTSGYMANLTKLSMEDPFVHLIFTQVLHLLKPPSVLFHPRIASAVFKYSPNGALRTPTLRTTPKRTT